MCSISGTCMGEGEEKGTTTNEDRQKQAEGNTDDTNRERTVMGWITWKNGRRPNTKRICCGVIEQQ